VLATGSNLTMGGALTIGTAAGDTANLSGAGTVSAGTFTGTGIVRATGGTLTLVQPLASNTGLIYNITSSSRLQLNAAPGTGNTFTFVNQAGNSGSLGLANDTGFTDTISGMSVGVGVNTVTDFIDIEGHTVTITSSTGNTGTSGTIVLSDGVTLNLANISAANWFPNVVTDGAGGTEVFITDTAVCFCRGTLIATDRGEVAVEELAVGDKVKTLSGAVKPVVWIGIGRDLVTRTNRLARPVIVRRGALGDNVPRRDLYVTHGHALYFDGVLIPVENLVNHRSIVWDEAAGVVEFYHIELEDHDVVFAEGAPAETYYEASNRALFHNTQPGSEAGAVKPTIVPVLNGGEVVEQVWAALYERAGGQIGGETTDDPDLHLVIDGKRLDAASVDGRAYTFALDAPPAGNLALCSRSGVPSLLGITGHDHRRLGVVISRIDLRAPGTQTSFGPDAWLFREGGAHPAEQGYCWTDGEFEMPAQAFAQLTGPFTLTVHTERPGMRYPVGKAA